MSRKDTPPSEESVQVDRAALAARVQAMREQMIGEVVDRFVAPKNTKVSETSPVVVTADDPAVQEMMAILSGKTEDRGVDRTNATSSPEPDTSTPTRDSAPTSDTVQDVAAPAVGGKVHKTQRRNSVPNHQDQNSRKKRPRRQGSNPQSSGTSAPSQTSHPVASPTPDTAIPGAPTVPLASDTSAPSLDSGAAVVASPDALSSTPSPDQTAVSMNFPMSDGEVSFYRINGSNGRGVSVQYIGPDQYDVCDVHSGSKIDTLTMAALTTLAAQEGWQLAQANTGTSPESTLPTERGGDVLKGRDPKGYDELFEGDEWVQYGSDGQEVRRIKLNIFYALDYPSSYKGELIHIVDSANDITKTDFGEELNGVLAARTDRVKGIDKPITEVREILQQGGFVLVKAGERSENGQAELKIEEGVKQPEHKNELSIGGESKAVVAARALVAEKREEFIRLERDQKGAWLKLMNFFRTTVGKEHDLSPEVAEAMERYKNSLTELLNLEIENIKQSDLKGEALRQAIAGLVRQFEFAEGETLDEGRRKARLGEGGAEALTDKWKKVWGHTRMAAMTGHEVDGLRILGALLEASGATAYRVGVQYNQLTNTTGRKVAAAVLGAGAVGVIVFTGGGAAAATAGLVLGLKKLGAAAGTTVTVKGVTDAVAQRGRERRAEKNTEKMLGSLKLTKKDEVEQSRNSEDTSTAAASEAVLTEEKIFELKNYLQQSAIEKMAKRGAIRRMGRLWRNTVAGVAGGAIALTAPSTFGRALEATQGIFDGGEAATGRIARVIEQGASAPRPAAVVSAAEAAASAPSGAASAASAAVQEIGQPAQGGPELPTEGEGNVPTELPNALNQSREFYQSGLAPDVVKLEGLMGDKVVARGDTLWKYALDGGKAAGLDETQQSRFAALLRDKLTEKLSMVDPDAAKAAGFAPNKAGIFTPNFIRTGDTLHLDKLLTTSDLQQLLEEAKQPSAAGGVADAVSSGKPDIFNTNYTSLEQAARDAVKVYGEVPDPDVIKPYANLEDAARDAVKMYGEVDGKGAATATADAAPFVGKEMVTPSQDVLTKLIELKEWGNGEKFNIALSDYLSSLPRFDQVSLFREIRGTVRDLFDTPEISLYNNYDANYDFSLHPELAKASVARVLADHAALADKFYITYDRTVNPLHWTQMQQVAQFAEGAVKTLGEDLAKPLTGEGIDEYTRRIAILAHAKGVTFPGLRMIQ